MKKVALMAAAAVLVLVAGDARAGYITGTTPSSNNILGQVDGYFGANLYLSTGGPSVSVAIDYLGKEAGYSNAFRLDFLGGHLDQANVDSGNVLHVVSIGSHLIGPGLINFRFTTPEGTVTNGANTLPPVAPNFFLSFGSGPNFLGDPMGGAIPSSGNSVIIALDDGGAGPDDNHDDMVMRLTVTGGEFIVPDGGATLMLLGGALMGLGALRRAVRG